MKILGVVLIIVLSVFSLMLFVLHIKSRRPFRSATINTLLGLAAFAAVNFAARFTGVRVPVNIYTVPGCAIFGLPAVAAYIVLQILF